MNEEFDKIGDLFKNTLNNHRMEGGDNLWNRLESQLSAQPPVSLSKPGLLRHLSFVKAAVAASTIIGVALAFNYIYLPLKNNISIPDGNKNQLINIKTDTVIDAPSVDNGLINKENNYFETKENTKSNKQESLKQLVDQSNTSTPSITDNLLSNNTNNKQFTNQTNNPVVINQQNPINKIQPTPTNNFNKISPKKDSLQQFTVDHNFDRNQLEPNQTINSNQDVTKVEELIKDTDIPNFFTPNYDGYNDYFVIKNIEKASSNQLVIKDRNGKTIFEKINYQNDWDGKNTTDGVYFFFLKYNASGNNFGKYGSITIKR
ncbi:MAG: gliding motility-associated C-terminal domain-containing protein [Bacteroidales bacterium]